MPSHERKECGLLLEKRVLVPGMLVVVRELRMVVPVAPTQRDGFPWTDRHAPQRRELILYPEVHAAARKRKRLFKVIGRKAQISWQKIALVC